MAGKEFFILDVFAEEKYAGNQLAVFINAGKISSGEMQKIAQEMHYSETTFILSNEKRDGGYDVRIFTPKMEVPFAGHPTLGTAYLISKEIAKASRKIVLNLKCGKMPVKAEKDVLWMRQNPPKFGKIFDAGKIAGSLGLKKEDIDKRFPVQEVSTGMPFVIAPLKTLEAVKRARVNVEKFFALVKSAEAKAILVFCPETYDRKNQLNVRVFVDYYGVPEDPATGSGNGCLAGYLSKYRYFGKSSVDARVEQGYEIGRRSLLFLKAEETNGEIEIDVGGSAVIVAKGEFR